VEKYGIDIQSATAEIRREKEEEGRRRKKNKPQDENIMAIIINPLNRGKSCNVNSYYMLLMGSHAMVSIYMGNFLIFFWLGGRSFCLR